MIRLRFVFCVAMAALASCRKQTPDAPPAPPAAASLEVEKTGKWLYTYATPEGRFETADAAEVVPEVSRGVVRAQNPEANAAADAAHVWVVNLAKVLEEGRAPAKQVPRALFETQAMALLPPGASSILAERPDLEPDAGGQGEPQQAQARQADVILYGTSWCGACRTARQHFLAKNIPFIDKDIEKDPAAAEELRDKAAKLGISADRVPVLDVRGRLLIGFDARRVQALLGDMI